MQAGLAFMVIGVVSIILSLFISSYLLIPGIIFLIVGAALLYVEHNETRAASEKSKSASMNQMNWRCPQCGYLNPADTVFCGKCGQKKIELPSKNWFCQDCGRENPTGTEYCGQCGKKIR